MIGSVTTKKCVQNHGILEYIGNYWTRGKLTVAIGHGVNGLLVSGLGEGSKSRPKDSKIELSCSLNRASVNLVQNYYNL